jgi:hypothetical protein
LYVSGRYLTIREGLHSRAKALNREVRRGFAKVAEKSKIEIGYCWVLQRLAALGWTAEAAVPTWAVEVAEARPSPH